MAVLETKKQLLHIALDLYRKHPKHSDGLYQVVKLILTMPNLIAYICSLMYYKMMYICFITFKFSIQIVSRLKIFSSQVCYIMMHTSFITFKFSTQIFLAPQHHMFLNVWRNDVDFFITFKFSIQIVFHLKINLGLLLLRIIVKWFIHHFLSA